MRRQAQSSHLRAFSGAVAILALATAARYALTPLVGETGLPYLTYFPAIAAVGWIGSVPLALFATVLAAAIANLLFVAPAFGIVLTLPTVVSLLAFIVTGGAIAMLTARLEAAAMESAARARQADERAAALEVERENLQRESRRLRLLADVSTMGVANATFLDVAQHAVRRLAEEIGDASVVRLLDGEQLNAIAWHHVESEARPLLEAALL